MNNVLLHGKYKKKWRIMVSVAIPFSFVFLTACWNNNVVEIPEMVEIIPDGAYPIYAEGVIDIGYCKQDNEYFVEYNKDSILETKDASLRVSCYTNPGGVVIFCSEEDLDEFIAWYYNMQHDDTFSEECTLFYIQRFVTKSSDTRECYYELVRK